MWETLTAVLTDKNALIVLIFITIFIILIAILAKRGIVTVNTTKFHLGNDVTERDIIRQQVEWSHLYISSLYTKINSTNEYGGYLTKYILECVYSEVVDWITFNHIKIDSEYIAIKQARVRALVAGFDIGPEFRTKQFEKKIDDWVEYVIKKLACIRAVYK